MNWKYILKTEAIVFRNDFNSEIGEECKRREDIHWFALKDVLILCMTSIQE